MRKGSYSISDHIVHTVYLEKYYWHAKSSIHKLDSIKIRPVFTQQNLVDMPKHCIVTLVSHDLFFQCTEQHFLSVRFAAVIGRYPYNTKNISFVKAYFCSTEAITKMSDNSSESMISHTKSRLKVYKSLWLLTLLTTAEWSVQRDNLILLLGKSSASPLTHTTQSHRVTELNSLSRPRGC